MLQLWKSMVIPHLDYCSQLWNPHLTNQIKKLEDLQKSFIRRINGFHKKSYWQSLKELGLYSLQRRRERYQIIYLWSILESQVPNICPTEPIWSGPNQISIPVLAEPYRQDHWETPDSPTSDSILCHSMGQDCSTDFLKMCAISQASQKWLSNAPLIPSSLI